MFSTFFQPCEIKLHLLQNTIFLHPDSEDTVRARSGEDLPPPANDQLVRGLVEIHAPQQRHIAGIRVKLRGVQTVAILDSATSSTPMSWEDSVIMEKVVEIGLHKNDRSRRPASRTGSPIRSARESLDLPNGDGGTAVDTNGDHTPPSRGRTSGNVSPSAHGISSIANAVGRAVSRGRSRPGSQPGSRSASRNQSPVRHRDLATPSASLLNGSNSTRRSASAMPASSSARHGLPPSPAELDRRLSLSIQESLDLGHPDNDNFGLGTPLPAGRGGNGSLVGSGGSARGGTRSSSMGWSPFGNRSSSVRNGRAASRQRDSSVPLEGSGIELERGVHGFEFSFILPAESPPYERSPFGRVRYVIKATAIGAGRARSNVETWRDIFPVVNPNPDGGPTPLTVLYNDNHPTVGLLSIACTSNAISVGGVFNIDIHSPAPPDDLIVYLVRVSIETTTELKTLRKGKQRTPTRKLKLFEKGWVPPKSTDIIGEGDGKKAEGIIRNAGDNGAWTVQGIARMPDDNMMRASSVEGSKAKIRFGHQLVVEVVHARLGKEASAEQPATRGDLQLKVFALRQPVLIPSCCVAYSAVTLPPYTPDNETDRDPNQPYDVAQSGHSGSNSHVARASSSTWVNTGTPQQGTTHDYCVCGLTLTELSDAERNMIPQGVDYQPPIDSIRGHGKIGELPLARTRSRSSAGSARSRSGRSVSISRGDSIRRTLSRTSRNSNSSTQRAPSAGGEIEGRVTTGSTALDGRNMPAMDSGRYAESIVSNPPEYEYPEEDEQGEREAAEEDEEDSRRGRQPVRAL